MKFNYKARNPKGNIQKGVVEADSKEEAFATLDSHDLTVLELVAQEEIPTYKKEIEVPFLNRITQKDMVVFSRELSTLVGGKVALVEALRSLARQMANPRFQRVLSEVAQDVEGGSSLSQAMSQHRDVFSGFYINLIRSAEAAGTLEKTLSYLADYQEKRYETISAIRGAMTYPAFVVGGTIIIGILVMIFIVPKITGILAGGDVELPLPTKILIGVSNALKNYWYLLIVASAGGAYGFWSWVQTEQGRGIWHTFLLKIPYFGKIFQKFYLNRIASNLSTLLKGGVSIIRSLDITSQVIGNQVYEKIMLESKEQVRVGKSISSVFAFYPEIPPMFAEMVKVGEKSGNIDEMFEKLATFYQKEVDRIIENLSELIEPVLIIIIGAGVAFFALSVIMPIYSMTEAI